MFPSRTNGTLVDSDVAEAAVTAVAALVVLPEVEFGEEAPLLPPPLPAHAAEWGGNVDDPCRMSVMYCLTNLM